MKLHFYFFILSILLLVPDGKLWANLITEVRGAKFIFSIKTDQDWNVGDVIEIVNDNKIVGKAKIAKLGKKAALATMIALKSPIAKGMYIRQFLSAKSQDMEEGLEEKEQEDESEEETDVEDTKKGVIPKKKKPLGMHFFLEPMLYVMSGTISQKGNVLTPLSGTTELEGDISGFQIELRGGYLWQQEFFGVQIQKSSGKHKNMLLVSEFDGQGIEEAASPATYTKTELGFFAGMRFNSLFKGWATVLKSEMNTKESNGIEKKYDGYTFLIGLGCQLIRKVSINVEAGRSLYNKENGGPYPRTQTIAGQGLSMEKFEQNILLVGFSYTLDL